MVNQTDQVFKIYYIHTKGGGLAQWLIKLHLKLEAQVRIPSINLRQRVELRSFN
jgi:hypothetical protein